VSVPIASPVYTIGAGPTAWQGNVTDDWGIDWIVESEDGWSSSPAIRALMEDKTSGDGTWNGPGAYGARVITLGGKALASDRVSMLMAKDRIRACMGPRNFVPIQVDEAHMSRMALIRQSDVLTITDSGAYAFSWSMIMTAPDPRRYATSPTTGTTGLPTVNTMGRTYNEAFPVLYGGGSSSTGSVAITNYGDFDEAPAVITFNGPIVTPRVAHVPTGRILTFNITVAEGDTLVLDLANQTVLLNGTANRKSSLTPSSAWFMLRPGENELQFRGQAGTSAAGTAPTMTVTASSAWT
jgi:hypothetical protein